MYAKTVYAMGLTQILHMPFFVVNGLLLIKLDVLPKEYQRVRSNQRNLAIQQLTIQVDNHQNTMIIWNILFQKKEKIVT